MGIMTNYFEQADKMIADINRHGLSNHRVLNAMRNIPRHLFIPESYRKKGDPYGDHPHPIGHGQTISQPFIVAYMTMLLDPSPGERALDVGCGSGYQSAVLAEMGADVVAVEREPALVAHARSILSACEYNVDVQIGDGYDGWLNKAPYDLIIVGCAPPIIPPKLVSQLAAGGRMVLPVGVVNQKLVLLKKINDKIISRDDISVIFVPMVPGG